MHISVLGFQRGPITCFGTSKVSTNIRQPNYQSNQSGDAICSSAHENRERNKFPAKNCNNSDADTIVIPEVHSAPKSNSLVNHRQSHG